MDERESDPTGRGSDNGDNAGSGTGAVVAEEEAEPEIIDLTGEEIRPEKEPRIVEYKKKREATAKLIAQSLIMGFLILLAIPYIFLYNGGATVAEVVDLQKNISVILGGILGSVVGYYFRSVQEEQG
ncbi:hypothetical protein H8E65_08005 [Candidatus Bathyarchaeota archaeon]|nr:hypothetical protein [Candidatus Bathyarchaeota archaeon]MBL7080073.1 hypothetical protein [Candidatus Bathyarchaeota archaeon]